MEYIPDEIPELGRKLKAYRKAAELTQEQLARKIGMDPLYYATIEREERTPSLKMLYRICYHLGIAPGSLLDVPNSINTKAEELLDSIYMELEHLSPKQVKMLLNFMKYVLPLM